MGGPPQVAAARPGCDDGRTASGDIMRILLTGAGGFVGRSLAPLLMAAGHDVIGIMRGPGASPPPFPVVIGDLASLDRLPHGDAVIHLAATSPAPGIGMERFARDNVAATHNLLRLLAGRQLAAFLHFSSVSIHGRVVADVIDEDTPVRDPDDYGLSKLMAERLVAQSGHAGLALRLPGVIGPGAERPWLAQVLRRIKAGETVSIVNPDSPFNNAVDVATLAPFIIERLAQIQTGFRPLVLAADGMVSIRQAVETLAQAARCPLRLVVEEAVGRKAFTLCHDRAKALGYRPPPVAVILQRYGASYG